MQADSVRENHRPVVTIYKQIMSGIQFMEDYIDDPDVFNPESINFKNFLIQSFCFLYPDFHYLSFLRKEDVDPEIIRVASILQLIPASAKKIIKLFDSMTNDDVHKFWLKFFTLFSKQNDFSTTSLFNISWENKINFFKDMRNTLSYLNYEFPVSNMRKLNYVDIDKEIENWIDQVVISNPDELTSFSNYDEPAIEVDIEKLIIDLKQVLSLWNNQKFVKQQIKCEHVDFFINLIHHTKNILKYKKDLSAIKSTVLDEFNFNIFSTDENFPENLYFLKRCNNLLNTLKSNIKSL